MDATKLDTLRQALLERRDQVKAEVDQLDQELRSYGADQENEPSGLGNHLAETGTEVMAQETNLAIASDLRDVLQWTEEALQRMEDGTYGICQRCGEPINEERLEAFPYVAHCIACQTLIERQRAMGIGH